MVSLEGTDALNALAGSSGEAQMIAMMQSPRSGAGPNTQAKDHALYELERDSSDRAR